MGCTFMVPFNVFAIDNRRNVQTCQPSDAKFAFRMAFRDAFFHAIPFRIRTSETPLPQLLYNPHLQTPLGSAGNKGLITPLESALTGDSPVTPLQSALTKTWGWGSGYRSLVSSRAPLLFWKAKMRGCPSSRLQNATRKRTS